MVVTPKTAGIQNRVRKFLKDKQVGGADNNERIWNMSQLSLFNFEINSWVFLCIIHWKFSQSLLDDNVVTRFPVYTKSYHLNEYIDYCRRTSKIKNKWKIPLNFILQRWLATMKISKGIIYLVRLQNFPKNKHFLPPDTHKHVYVSGDRNVSFPKNFANVLN